MTEEESASVDAVEQLDARADTIERLAFGFKKDTTQLVLPEAKHNVVSEMNDVFEENISEDLINFCKAIKYQVKKDYDCVIAVTGLREGIGKSTFAIQASRLLSKNFDLEKNVVFSPDTEQVKNLITKLPRGSPIILDEAIKILFSRLWYSESNIFLNKFYKIARKYNQITFVCIPDVHDIDSKFFQTKVWYWVYVLERGLAVVFQRDWNPGLPDKWHLKELSKNIEMVTSKYGLIDQGVSLRLNALRRAPNYIGIIHFNDLPNDLQKKYRELSEEAAREMEDKPENKWINVYRQAFGKLAFYLRSKKMLAQEIAGISGLSVNVVNEICRHIKKTEKLNEQEEIEEGESINLSELEKTTPDSFKKPKVFTDF